MSRVERVGAQYEIEVFILDGTLYPRAFVPDGEEFRAQRGRDARIKAASLILSQRTPYARVVILPTRELFSEHSWPRSS